MEAAPGVYSACGAGGARRLFLCTHGSGRPARSTPGPSAYSGTDNRARDLGESAAAAALAPGQHSHLAIPGQLPHRAHEHCWPPYAGCGPLDEDTGLRLAASSWGRVSRSEASCCLMSPRIRQLLSISSLPVIYLTTRAGVMQGVLPLFVHPAD